MLIFPRHREHGFCLQLVFSLHECSKIFRQRENYSFVPLWRPQSQAPKLPCWLRSQSFCFSLIIFRALAWNFRLIGLKQHHRRIILKPSYAAVNSVLLNYSSIVEVLGLQLVRMSLIFLFAFFDNHRWQDEFNVTIFVSKVAWEQNPRIVDRKILVVAEIHGAVLLCCETVFFINVSKQIILFTLVLALRQIMINSAMHSFASLPITF